MANEKSNGNTNYTLSVAAGKVKGCPVAHHIAMFTEKKPNNTPNLLTTESMTNGHTVQGITDGVYVKCWAIQNLLNDRKMPHTLDQLLTVENPARTGLWNANGQFDNTVFEDLAKSAVKDEKGVAVLTREIVMTWLQKKHAGKTLGKATTLAYVVPVSWEAVTEGSIKELFMYYSDSFIKSSVNNGDEIIPAMTLTKFKRFYTDPSSVVQERIASLKNK